MQNDLKIAFIGLGNMGGPMALNLLNAKFKLTVFDLMPQAVETLVAQGATSAKTAIEAVSGADVVISMLPAGKHVEALYLGTENQAGLISVLDKKCLGQQRVP